VNDGGEEERERGREGRERRDDAVRASLTMSKSRVKGV